MQSVSTRCTVSRLTASNNHETRQDVVLLQSGVTNIHANKQTKPKLWTPEKWWANPTLSLGSVQTELEASQSPLSGAKVMNS